MTDSEEVLPCRRCDQIFNSWDEFVFHIRLQHSKTCYECFEKIKIRNAMLEECEDDDSSKEDDVEETTNPADQVLKSVISLS